MTNKSEMVHELRIQTVPFEDLLSGVKTGEVRNSDRGFKVGDSVLLNEVSGTFPVPTGRQMRRKITHIQTGYGLPDGIVVLSYAPAEDVRALGEEPAAWMDPRSPEMHATISNEVKQHNLTFGGAPSTAVNGYSIPLYRRPQRQVVLPDFNDWYPRKVGVLGTESANHDKSVWNACIDECERLNK